MVWYPPTCEVVLDTGILIVSPARQMRLGGVTFMCSWKNSIGRRGSLEERGGGCGETVLTCVSMCSTLMEELWRGSLQPMGCWPHQLSRK
jgi:hypothetical protein